MKFTLYFALFALAAVSSPVALSSRAARPSHRRLARAAKAPAAASFAADPSINVAGIYGAAVASNTHTLASYPTTPERKAYTNIYGDWQNFANVSAFHFIADMDVDCDGPKVSTSATVWCQTLTT
jgi:hypothetical protein